MPRKTSRSSYIAFAEHPLIRRVRSPMMALLATVLGTLMLACGSPKASVEVDFTATAIVAAPDTLLQTDLLTASATISNTGNSDSGSFLVRAYLKAGTDCNGSTYLLGEQVFDISGGSSAAFEVSRIIDNVPSIGLYYLCLHLDSTGQVSEVDENNNWIGGTTVPVMVVGCLYDAACDDDNLCTTDSCEPTVGCLYESNTLPCDDDNLCTTDSCEPTVGCLYEFNTLPCEDELFCTVNDVCGGGACQRGPPRECVDSDLCDGTLYCDEMAGACTNGPAPSCDDGDVCNGAETCNPVDGTCLAGAPISCEVLVNNGLAPPIASNLIDHVDYNEASGQLVYVRSQGCPPFGGVDSSPCPIPGVPTTLEVAVGGDLGDVDVFDTALLQVTGGSVQKLASGQNAWVDLLGGAVASAESYGTTFVAGGDHGFLRLLGQATVTGGSIQNLLLDSDFISPGGAVWGGKVETLFSGTASSVRGGRVSVLCAVEDPGTVYGSQFNLNAGMYGPFPGATGFVSGTLESGDLLNATYHQTGSWCYHPEDGVFDTSGTFTLLPPESTFVANGQSFPDPQNVFDEDDAATQFHDVFVRNESCPDLWPSAYPDDPCTLPGIATSVEVVGGAVIPGVFSVLDTSTAIIRGGQVAELRMSAGASIEIWGNEFTIGGVPVPFGEVLDESGMLVGTLATGEPIVASFDREDPLVMGTYGVIVLRSASELVSGNNVVGTLFGGLGSIGGVEVDRHVENGGILIGEYESIALADINQQIPDFIGLATPTRGFEDQHQIWELEFSGTLLDVGHSRATFAYDPALVQEGQQLIIFAWDGAQWVRMKDGVVIDSINHTISIVIDSFTIFAPIIREFMVPVLSVFGMLSLAGGLAVSGLIARNRSRVGGGA